MHKRELRDRQSLCSLFPLRDGVDLSLEGLKELNRDDVREPLLLKPFDELLQVKPAVGNNPQNPDATPDKPVGIGKEGKDVVPGGDVAGTIPQVDDVFAPSEKRQEWAVTWPAVFNRVVSSFCSFLFSIPEEHGGVESEPVFSNRVPGDKPAEIGPYIPGECFRHPDRFQFIEHSREGCCRIRQSPYSKHLCEDIFVAQVHTVGESLCTGKDHCDKGDALPVDPHGVRRAFSDRHRLLYHLRKADSLKERSDKGRASIGSHLSFGEGYFDFVYLRHCGRISVHSFVPPFA